MNNPQETYNVINKFFKAHFQKADQNPIIKFLIPPKRLNKRITAEEVRTAIWKMANNKAAGEDGVLVELLKYGPTELYKLIADILNQIFEQNDDELKVGKGILLPLPKPKKAEGPVKNL